MRRLQSKTWLNFAATLLLAAVISPMADATQAAVSSRVVDGTLLSPHVRMDKVVALDGGEKASNKPTVFPARINATLAVAQIPTDLNGGVYYDTRQAPSELGGSVPTQETGSSLSGVAVPGKWTSLLATVLLFGFLFWRRAS